MLPVTPTACLSRVTLASPDHQYDREILAKPSQFQAARSHRDGSVGSNRTSVLKVLEGIQTLETRSSCTQAVLELMTIDRGQ